MSADVPERYATLPHFAFGDSPELADELLALVLAGLKTATCCAIDDPSQSLPGQQWIVTDGQGRPACVIETTELAHGRFNEVDASFARDEGEGDLSLESWRRNHRRYFERNGGFTDDMMLVCERFRLVEILENRRMGT